MSDGNVVTMKTDQQKADEIKAAMRGPLEQIAVIMTQAHRDGLKVAISINVDGFGRFRAPDVDITKAL
jgi:O-succinylbenzoate synthase